MYAVVYKGKHMEFEKIEKKTLRQKVYEQLKEKMTTAEILPGEQISLRELARSLGVSLMPVREALWQLESEKVVVIESNRRMWVNSLTPEEVDEISKIRLTLEIMAGEMACELRPQSSLPRVEEILSGLHGFVGAREDYLKQNWKYHFFIYSLSQAPNLVDIIKGLWARYGPYLYLVTLEKADVIYAMHAHDAIYKALVDRDKKGMAEAIQDDLGTAAENIKGFLEKQAAEGDTAQIPRI